MHQEGFEFHVSFQKLLIGLLLTVVPISVAGLYALASSRQSLEQNIGSHLTTIAQSTSVSVAQFVHDCMKDVGTLAIESSLVDAVAASNRAYRGMDEKTLASRIGQTEKIWSTPAAAGMVNQILDSRASRQLRRFRELDRRFLRITVTDQKGAVVAATHKTLDYYQADEEFWQNIYAQGRGAISLTDILYDEVTKSNYIGLGIPVMDETSNTFIGAVDALVDVTSLFPLVSRTGIGPTGKAMLVKDDGTVIAAPDVTLAMNLKSDELAAVNDAMSTLPNRNYGWVRTSLKSGVPHFIAFADTGLKRDYRNMSWLVLVSQDAREALAPVKATERLLAFMALVGLAMVTLLAAYFAMHRRQPMEDLGEEIQKPAAAGS